MQLSVIIVSYNVKYILEQCLYALRESCEEINAEIIVVDNASADNTIPYLQQQFSDIIFIQNDVNVGFSKANNHGLAIAKGEYILFLNPDVITSKESINNCLSFLMSEKKIGLVSVKMIDNDGNFLPESKRSFPSVTASFFKLSGLAALFPDSSVFNRYALGNLDENKAYEVDVLCGAFMFCKKEILAAVNGFDEAFFMYGEDIDLSYRIKQIRYKNFYLGDNVIVHFKGSSTKKMDTAYTRSFYDAMKIFIKKHYQNKSLPFLNAGISVTEFISSFSKKMKGMFLTNQTATNEIFFLAGTEKATTSAAEILLANSYAFQKVITNDNTFNAKQALSIKSQKKLNLVFCIDKLKYSGCIKFIQNNKNKYNYYWHKTGSGSIVTGNKKDFISQIYVSI